MYAVFCSVVSQVSRTAMEFAAAMAEIMPDSSGLIEAEQNANIGAFFYILEESAPIRAHGKGPWSSRRGNQFRFGIDGLHSQSTPQLPTLVRVLS